MFIYESIKVGMKYDFYLEVSEMTKIFETSLKHDNKAIVIVQKNLHSLHNDTWISLSKTYNKPIFFSFITYCYSPFSDMKEPYIFIARNTREYNLLKNINLYFENQFFPHLSEQAISFFNRVNIPVFHINHKKHTMTSLLDRTSFNLIPFIPCSEKKIHFPQEMIPKESFFSTVKENIDSIFNEWVNTQKPYINWAYVEHEVSSIEIEDFISYNNFIPIEIERIHKEIKWIKQNKLDTLFLVSSYLKKEFDVFFEGSFNCFLLSNALNLVDKNRVMESNLNSLPKDIIHSFNIRTDPTNQIYIFEKINESLSIHNFQLKFPLHYKNIPIQTTINLQEPLKDLLEINEMAKGMELLKEIYDLKNEDERKYFIEEMKLHFLFFPEQQEMFFTTIYLEKNTYQKELDFNKIAILPKNNYLSKGDTLLMDYRAALHQKIPIINICN